MIDTKAKPAPRPAMTRIMKREKLSDSEVVLRHLGGGWHPWNYQVAVVIDDGAAYGNPGKPTSISVANYLAEVDAIAAYERAGGSYLP